MELPSSASTIGAGYTFIGPDCVFAGGPSGEASLVKWEVNGEGASTANVMVYSESGSLSGAGSLTGQASADTLVTVSPSATAVESFERGVGAAWDGLTGGRVEGRVGGVRWYQAAAGRLAVDIQALEGEVFKVSV